MFEYKCVQPCEHCQRELVTCEHADCGEPATVEVEHYACGVLVATTLSCATHRNHCREASVVLSHVERAL